MDTDWNNLSEKFGGLCQSFRALRDSATTKGNADLVGRLQLRLNRLIDEKQAIDAIIEAQETAGWSDATFKRQAVVAQMILSMSQKEFESNDG